MTLVRARVALFTGLLLASAACSRQASTSPEKFARTRSALSASTSAAQVKDILSSGSSNPTDFARLGDRLYFVATSADAGTELWVTDGTTEGTNIAADLKVGVDSSTPSGLTVTNDRLYFIADDGVAGSSLWTLTNAAPTPVRLTAVAAGSRLSAVDAQLFFVGSDMTAGNELWVTDGTTASMVKELNPAGHAAIGDMVRSGSWLFFAADNGTDGVELWKTDGTEAETTPVADLNTTGSAHPDGLTAFDGFVFFTADDGNGVALWKTDGTAPTKVADVAAKYLTVADGGLFYVVESGTSAALWRCEAAATAPALVKSFDSVAGARIGGLTAGSSALYFVTDDGVHGRELWKTDGTAPGTVLLKDTNPNGDGFVGTPELEFLNGVLLFAATDGVSGVELWKSDGHSLGTAPVADLAAGAASSLPAGFVSLGSKVFFAADDGASGRELWSVPLDAVTAPSIACPENVTAEATSAAGATVTFDPAEASDSAGAPTITYSQDSGTAFPMGETTVTATATNAATLTAECSFKVTVVDTTAPVLTCPADVTITATAADGMTATFANATVTDAVSTPTITYSHTSGAKFPIGVTTVTASATDDAGLTGTCTFRVDIQDLEAPKITCPPSFDVEATVVGGAKLNALPPATATDNLGTPTVTYNPAAGSTFPMGTNFVIATATDAYGNTASCGYTILVRDTLAPVLTCAPDQTIEATAPTGAPAPALVEASARDTGSEFTLTYAPPITGTFAFGQTTVAVRAEDAEGNFSTCSFKLTVQDTTAPALTCPEPVTVEPTASTGVEVNYPPATVTEAVTVSPKVTYTSTSGTPLPAGSTFPIGTTVIVVNAEDDAGNKSTQCRFDVIVKDTLAPEIECPSDVAAEANVTGGAFVPFAPAVATDAASTPTISYTQGPGSKFPLGETQVTASARDTAGNTASCSFNVTVTDTQKPLITCPPDVNAQATSSTLSYLRLPSAFASDLGSAPTVTYSPSLFSPFPMGTTQVTATATDASGNSDSCTFNVNVADTQPPSLTCPSEVVREAAGPTGATVSFPPALGSDSVSATSISYSAASGSLFPIGSTPVTVTASDAENNSLTCTFPVIVRDSVAPLISCPGHQEKEATSPEGVAVTFPAATATDAVSTPVITYSHTSGMAFPLGQTAVTATAKDAAGNEAGCTFNVVVKDSVPPELICPENLVVEATSAAGALVAYTKPTATDTVTVMPFVKADRLPGSRFPLGRSTVNLTATDSSGNRAECSFDVTVTDTVGPTLSCPSDITINAPNNTGAVVTFALPTAEDAVTPSSALEVRSSIESGSVFPIGATTVTLSSMDNAANIGTCEFTVNVNAPVTEGGCSSAGSSGWALLLVLAAGWRLRRRAA